MSYDFTLKGIFLSSNKCPENLKNSFSKLMMYHYLFIEFNQFIYTNKLINLIGKRNEL